MCNLITKTAGVCNVFSRLFLALFVFTMVLLNIFQNSKIGQINEKLVINSIFKS